ncbi:hypothetical protein AGMMS49991_06680 [Spirochaetia bacterium]|nr:hypothetical protein AGMMS49991_06680 [Spirochaetia bacterium]
MANKANQLLFDFSDDPLLDSPNDYSHPSTQSRIIIFPTQTQSVKQDRAAFNPESLFRPYGAWLEFGKRLTTSQRIHANKQAIEILQKPPAEITPDDITLLRSYSGWGGLSASNERGVLYDYYTSPPIAAMTWKILNTIHPIQKDARILEPSCGTGVFFETAPMGVHLYGIELDERTASIATLIHPRSHITHQSYEAFNLSTESASQFDHIIGNAPFGERTLETAFMDMREEKSLDRYFITRSLDNLKPNGTLAMIVHPGLLANKTNESWRLDICRKAQFMGAIKLNDDSFNHTHTGIQPDILLFRKHPQDIQQRLQTFSVEALNTLELALPNWVSGDYFSTHPAHVMGTIEAGKGQWGSDIISGAITPESIQSLLDTFSPETPFTDLLYDRVRDTIPLPELNKKSPFLSLNTDEIEALKQKLLTIGSIKTVDSAVYLLTDTHQWRLVVSDNPSLVQRIEQILTISQNVKAIRKVMREGQPAELLQSTVKTTLNAYKDHYGAYPKDDALITRFLRNHPSVSGIYDALTDTKSDILSVNNLYNTNGTFIQGHNRAVEALLFLQQRMLDGTPETITQYFPDEADELITEMYRNPDIFLSPEGTWQLREDFIAGNAWNKIDRLTELVNHETDTPQKDKWRYGITELEKAVGWIPIEDADYTPHSSWISEHIINQWIRDEDGIDRPSILKHGKLSRNEEGKWGIRYDSDQTLYTPRTRDSHKVYQGQWEELADEIVYYLNMQKQRSRYNDTETFNREHNDNFKNYIANHKVYREELEKLYNRIFNTEIGVPVKTYPVYLEGWRTEVKSLKPHQWQSVHHLYRESKGISALGTGFGKTLAATALHALLQQEGKITRAWFQVPNNKVKDWIKEIHDVLPDRTIGFVDPEMPGYSNRDKRYALYQELAATAYDIILMPESSAGEIQLSPEQDALITEEVVCKHVAEKGEGKSDRKIETLKESEIRKLENGKTNRTICFEDFGCNALFVDEAHRYKNLFSSTLSRETGLNDGRQSLKAMALFKKAEYIRRTNNGKNVYLFTATPLTNSPLEYYNMLMYVAPEELEQFGINTIDGFIKNFADIETGPAYDWQNGAITEKKILKGFKNIQTLQSIFFKYTDYQNDPKKINLEKPDAHNKPNVIPLNPVQTGVLQSISVELEKYKQADKEERRELYPGQNFLTFYSRMRTASLDLELYSPSSYKDWQNPKLEILTNNVRQNYLATGGGQVIFCDRVFSSDMTLNIHEKIKQALYNTGFGSDEIVMVNGFTKSGGLKTDSLIEREVSQAVAAFNSGRYKVIIGSTACIGEGLNLQENSAALHHFDIPFRPSDFIQRNGRIDRQGNTQNSVELHTYMSAGTIDNYSVSLVQRKANWIDQLLKTKSNVFTNPNDENYIDADELLLALTEEWGDAEKAGERRQEMERIKADKMLESQHTQRRNNLASLSLMRNAVYAFSGDKGTLSYQNRIRKIGMLEKLLKNNQTFRQHEILNNNIPFLYAKETDSIIRKGDVLILSGTPYEITSLNAKKQECITRMMKTSKREELKEQIVTVTEFKTDNDRLTHISQPGKEDRQIIVSLHSAEFYYHPDTDLKERYYPLHLRCACSNNDFTPIVFNITDDGALMVKELRYYFGYDKTNYFNPYAIDDLWTIRNAIDRGVTFYNDSETDEYLKKLQVLLPELYDQIIPCLSLSSKPAA